MWGSDSNKISSSDAVFWILYNMNRMTGKVYNKSKKVWVIVRHSEDIKVAIATSNHIDLLPGRTSLSNSF